MAPPVLEQNMAIVKSQIEARIVELTAKFQQLSNDANAVSGAIQDCQFWLELADPDVHPLQKMINDFAAVQAESTSESI